MMTRFPSVPLSRYVFFQEGPGLRKWQWTESGMKVINVTNILEDGSVDITNTDRYISLEEFTERYRHFAVEYRDVVVASSGNTYGKVGRINRSNLPLMMNTSVIRFHSADREHLDDDYLFAFLRSSMFHDQVEQFVIGSAQPNFGPIHLKQMRIPLPSLEIQRGIAGIISPYDDLIEKNRRRIQILEEMARVIYREWFVEFRAPGVKLRKATPVERKVAGRDVFPEGWEVRELSDICVVVMGQSPESRFYNDSGEGLPFHQGVTNFGDRFPVDRMYCTVEGRIAERGDVLFSVRAPVGRINLATKRMVIGRGLCAIRGSVGRQEFVCQQLKERFQEEDIMGGGTIFKAVTKGDVHGIRMVEPEPATLGRFEEIIGPMFRALEVLTDENVNLGTTRDFLLPRLMSGEVNIEGLDVAMADDQEREVAEIRK